jgi:hypothetical protein
LNESSDEWYSVWKMYDVKPLLSLSLPGVDFPCSRLTEGVHTFRLRGFSDGVVVGVLEDTLGGHSKSGHCGGSIILIRKKSGDYYIALYSYGNLYS